MLRARLSALLVPFLGLVLGGAATATPAVAQQGSEPLVATDLLKLRQLGAVAVSPDGRQIAYTVQSIVPAGPDGYTYRTHLYLASADGREPPRQLTFGDHDATAPAWHPDGDRIAFVRPVAGQPQVFVLPLAGGESYQLTHAPHGAGRPQWSPDGSMLLFTSKLPEREVAARAGRGPRWPSERPGRVPGDTAGVQPDPDGSLAEIRAWLDRNASGASPRVFTRLDLQGETDLEAGPSFQHLFVLDVETEPGAAPAEARALTQGFSSFADPVWTPDSKQVVFSGAVVRDRHPDRVPDRDLFVVDADGSGFRTLLSLDGYALTEPVVSPQGRLLAFLATDYDDPGYAQTELGVVGLGDRTPSQLVTLAFDRSAGSPRWSDDGWYLYFVAASDGGFPLYRVRIYDVEPLSDSLEAPDAGLLPADSLTTDLAAPDTLLADTLAADSLLLAEMPQEAEEPEGPAREVTRLTGFDRGIRSFDLGRATVFYVATDAANPFELYAANLEFTRERRLTEHNAGWIAARRLSVPEPFTLVRDSIEVPYWIMKPAFFEPGQTYPLLVEIHGGPAVMWGPGEATMWFEFQFFAARGYGVVFGNPRGSEGYGAAYRRANYQDWAEGPAGDVLAVADEAARLPWVDPDRQVVTGGSYAGYLTAWIVAHDDRFKAAAAQRGVYDLGTFLGEGNAWRLVPEHFGGYPWEEVPEPEAAPLAADTTLPDPGPAEPRSEVAAALLDALQPGLPLPDTTSADTLLVDAILPVEASGADTTALPAGASAIAADTSAVEAPVAEVLDAPVEQGDAPGEPERPLYRERLLRSSPLTYVHRIRTPLLILHGDADRRTGVIQSEVLYKSLKILERPVEYVRYPGAGHELTRSGDPKHRIDHLLRLYEFFERFIGPG